MRVPLFLLSFSLANLAYSGLHYTMKAQSETRDLLSAEDMMRILPGNTLLTYDSTGTFWMYFPSPGTVWGRSSTGDVDIGSWWIEDDRYCRVWRRWYEGEPQCWQLASYEKDRVVWIDGEQAVQGESLIRQGNAIESVRLPLLASTAPDIAVGPAAISGNSAPQQAQASERSDRSGSPSSSDTSASGSSGASTSGNAGSGASSSGSAGGGSSGSPGGGGGGASIGGSSAGDGGGASVGGGSEKGSSAKGAGGGKGAKGNGAGKGRSNDGGDKGGRGGKGKK